MGKGNVLFQLRFAEMQLKTCNLFDVSVFLYEFIMLGTSTPACLGLLLRLLLLLSPYLPLFVPLSFHSCLVCSYRDC